MARRSLIEQLDEAVQGLLDNRKMPVPPVSARIAPLLRVAAELLDLPREEFKARLKDELGGKKKTMATMTEAIASTTQVATPYLAFKDAAKAIEFYQRVFGAKEILRLTEPGGRIGHAEIRIGNSQIMLSDESPAYGAVSPETLGGSSVKINLMVDDVDAVARRALAAGAREVRPVQDQFYGERSGQFADPFGYTWILATKTEDVSAEEMQRRYDRIMKGAEQPSAKKTSFIRPGFRTVTPYIMVRKADELIDFVKQAFGAQELYRGTGGGGGTHCEVRIGDSMMMLGGGGAWKGPERTAAIHLYVPDADAAYHRAIKAGATSLRAPRDQFYGDREGSVKDAFGNYWYIGTNMKTGGAPGGMNTVNTSFHPKGAGQMIEFLKNAFGAEEISRAQDPGGHVHYAQVKIGTSVVDMGEAHAEFQPMPTALYLYVEDTDAIYNRALQAGATSLYAPADQPYGDRNGGVLDPFGNEWYIGTHIRDVV